MSTHGPTRTMRLASNSSAQGGEADLPRSRTACPPLTNVARADSPLGRLLQGEGQTTSAMSRSLRPVIVAVAVRCLKFP